MLGCGRNAKSGCGVSFGLFGLPKETIFCSMESLISIERSPSEHEQLTWLNELLQNVHIGCHLSHFLGMNV